MKNTEKYASIVLRVGIALVFLYFGFSQVYSPSNWTTFVPPFLTSGFLSPNNFVVFNGFTEITLGIFLIIGLYTRFSAIILSLHLLGIAFSIGFSPIGVRDFGLAIATLVIFLHGSDEYSFDKRFENSNKKIILK